MLDADGTSVVTRHVREQNRCSGQHAHPDIRNHGAGHRANRGIGRSLVDALLERGAAKIDATARRPSTRQGIAALDSARLVSSASSGRRVVMRRAGM
jgi:hypothetical protein